MKVNLANLIADDRLKLNGFKVLGVFPFYLKYIKTRTHIQLCAIKEKMAQLTEGEPKICDFDDSQLQEKLIPLVERYIIVALLNNRHCGVLLKPFLKQKIKECSHNQILNLYLTIHKLNEPAFFLSYWKLIKTRDTTIISEEKQ